MDSMSGFDGRSQGLRWGCNDLSVSLPTLFGIPQQRAEAAFSITTMDVDSPTQPNDAATQSGRSECAASSSMVILFWRVKSHAWEGQGISGDGYSARIIKLSALRYVGVQIKLS